MTNPTDGRPGSPEDGPRIDNPVVAGMESGHSTTATGIGVSKLEKQTSLTTEAWGELRRNPLFVVSAVVVAVMIFVAIFPQIIAKTKPVGAACDLGLSRDPPTAGHPFGFDVQGCDVYASVIWGARPSVTIGLLASLGTVVIGVLLGSAAGFYGGWVDAILSRLTDIMFGFPFLVGAIVILTAFPDRNAIIVAFVLTAFSWPTQARIMRSSVFAAKSMDYVQAARALGASNGRLIFRHILPNAVTPVLVLATVGVGAIIGAESTLTFLGVGLKPPTNSWGISISQSQRYFLQAPHMLLFPALFLSATVLAFIVLGDAVRDAFDPKLR